MNISGVGEMGVGEMGQIIGETGVGEMGVGETGTSLNKDVNEYSNVRIFAFHTNIRMRFLDSNIRIIF